MNNIRLIFLFFSIFILFSNCSFDKKTGIWSGELDEKKRIAELEEDQKNKIEVIKVYSSSNVEIEELSISKAVKLSKPKKNLFWRMSGLNQQNFLGHIYFSGLNKNFIKKKIGKNKFTISKNISSPLVDNNNIIFSDDTGTIFSVNLDGKINWKKNIYKKIYKKIYKNLSFTIHENKIFVADNIGFIYSLSIDSGDLIWIKNHSIPIKSKIKIFKDKLFLINQDNRILCFDINKGDILWDVRTVSSFIKSQNLLSLAVSEKGDLVVLNSSGDLVKLNTSNGGIYWTKNIMRSMYAHDTDFFQSSDLVIYDNNIMFIATSTAFSINLDTALINWKIDINSTNIPIIDGNNIFLLSNDGYFLNVDKNTGNIIWSNNILKVLKKRKQQTIITGHVLGSGKIYATTLNGYMIVCSATLGKVEKFLKIGSQISTSPIISDGAIYILTDSPRIIGYK